MNALITNSNVRKCINDSIAQIQGMNEFEVLENGKRVKRKPQVIPENGRTTMDNLDRIVGLKVDMSLFENEKDLNYLKKTVSRCIPNLKFLHLFVPANQSEQCPRRFDFTFLDYTGAIEWLVIENMTVEQYRDFSKLNGIKRVRLSGTPIENFETLSGFPRDAEVFLDRISTYMPEKRYKAWIDRINQEALIKFFFEHTGNITVINSPRIEPLYDWARAVQDASDGKQPEMTIMNAMALGDDYPIPEHTVFTLDERLIKRLKDLYNSIPKNNDNDSDSDPKKIIEDIIEDINAISPRSSGKSLKGDFETLAFLIKLGIQSDIKATGFADDKTENLTPEEEKKLLSSGDRKDRKDKKDKTQARVLKIIREYVRDRRKNGWHYSEIIDGNHKGDRWNNRKRYSDHKKDGLDTIAEGVETVHTIVSGTVNAIGNVIQKTPENLRIATKKARTLKEKANHLYQQIHSTLADANEKRRRR